VEAKLSLTVPLYQSGSVYSRLRAAKQSVAKARRDIDQTRRNAIEVADRAWESLQTAKARITSFQAQVKASQIAQEGVEREAEVGSRTVLDVLDAEQERLDAEVNLVRAQRDELVAVYQVKAATGKLTARHLNLPVKYYDPKSHYQNVRNKWFGGSVSDQ
jgi:outer membrane protein